MGAFDNFFSDAFPQGRLANEQVKNAVLLNQENALKLQQQIAMRAAQAKLGLAPDPQTGIMWNSQGPPQQQPMATVMGNGGAPDQRVPQTAEGLMGAGVPMEQANLMNTGKDDYKQRMADYQTQQQQLRMQADPDAYMKMQQHGAMVKQITDDPDLPIEAKNAALLELTGAPKTAEAYATSALPKLSDYARDLVAGGLKPGTDGFAKAMADKQAKDTYIAEKDQLKQAQIISETVKNNSQAAKDDAQATLIKNGGGFTSQMGDLLGALTERGVSIPAGMRSRQQQISTLTGLISRNPDKTPDEIADMLKSGQISFGSEKKMATTAANIAGKVEVAGNEIEDFAPIALEASTNVPRGSFVPMTKLFQLADENISDPNLRTLKSYTQSIMNAYNLLGGRGGSDVAQREHNRSLLMSADSPEVYAAAIKAMQTESAVAHKAAIRAAGIKQPGVANPAVVPPPKILTFNPKTGKIE